MPTQFPKVSQFIKYTHYSMIMAREAQGGIGYKNGLPWPKCKSDMEWFRKHTLGKIIVMGRATFESLGSKPLPGRINIVVSTSIDKEVGRKWNTENPGEDSGYLIIAQNPTEVKTLISQTAGTLHNGGEVMIIGGAYIYEAFWNDISRLYLTTFEDTYSSDVKVDLDLSGFNKVYHDSTQLHQPTFEIYEPRRTFGITRFPASKEDKNV